MHYETYFQRVSINAKRKFNDFLKCAIICFQCEDFKVQFILNNFRIFKLSEMSLCYTTTSIFKAPKGSMQMRFNLFSLPFLPLIALLCHFFVKAPFVHRAMLETSFRWFLFNYESFFQYNFFFFKLKLLSLHQKKIIFFCLCRVIFCRNEFLLLAYH